MWSISRGLARGVHGRTEYMSMMDRADAQRRYDTDGRGNLSQETLKAFVSWFLQVCLDQITFMTELFSFETFERRLRSYVAMSGDLKAEASSLLTEAFVRENSNAAKRGVSPGFRSAARVAFSRTSSSTGSWHPIRPRGRFRYAFQQKPWRRFSHDCTRSPDGAPARGVAPDARWHRCTLACMES